MKLLQLSSVNLGCWPARSLLRLRAATAAPGKPGPEPETPRPEQVLDFATLYGQNCAACHGENGKNGAAIALANPVYLAIAGATNIQRITADGVPGTAMPPFAQIQRRHVDRPADRRPRRGHGASLGQSGNARWADSTRLRRQHSRQSRPGPEGIRHLLRALPRRRRHRSLPPATASQPARSSIPPTSPSISDQGLRSIILAGQTEQGPHDWRSYLIEPRARRR